MIQLRVWNGNNFYEPCILVEKNNNNKEEEEELEEELNNNIQIKNVGFLQITKNDINFLTLEDFASSVLVKKRYYDDRKVEKQKEKLEEVLIKYVLKNGIATLTFYSDEYERIKTNYKKFTLDDFRVEANMLYCDVYNFLTKKVSLDGMHYKTVTGYTLYANLFDFFQNLKIVFLLVQGEMGSGKSTLLENLEKLIFLTKLQVNPRAASLARSLHLFRSAALLDDFRITNIGEESEEATELLQIIRSAISPNATYQRYEEGTLNIYDIGSPIIFNTLATVPNDVRDRCINIFMFRTNFVPRSVGVNELMSLRQQLSIFRILGFKFKEILEKEILKNKEIITTLTDGRTGDVLAPLVYFAQFNKSDLLNLIKEKFENLQTVETFNFFYFLCSNYKDLLDESMRDKVMIDFEKKQFVDMNNNFTYDNIYFNLSSLILKFAEYELSKTYEIYAARNILEKELKNYANRVRAWLKNRLNAKIVSKVVWNRELQKAERRTVVIFDSATFFKHYDNMQNAFKIVETLEKEKNPFETLNQIKTIYGFGLLD